MTLSTWSFHPNGSPLQRNADSLQAEGASLQLMKASGFSTSFRSLTKARGSDASSVSSRSTIRMRRSAYCSNQVALRSCPYKTREGT